MLAQAFWTSTHKQLDISPPDEKWRQIFWNYFTVSYPIYFLASTPTDPCWEGHSIADGSQPQCGDCKHVPEFAADAFCHEHQSSSSMPHVQASITMTSRSKSVLFYFRHCPLPKKTNMWCHMRPKGKWLALGIQRYLTGTEVMFLMGFPLHRMVINVDDNVTRPTLTWWFPKSSAKIMAFNANTIRIVFGALVPLHF